MNQPMLKDAGDVLAVRDACLEYTRPLVERHMEERYIAIADTTLTEMQMHELIRYRLILRNLEKFAGFPNVDLPRAPSFIA